MRWVLQQSTGHAHYWSLDQHEPNLSLKYHSDSHAFRITALDKRLYFLERKGLFQHRILLKSEYSLPLGELHFIRNTGSGQLLIDDQRFNFSIQQGEYRLWSQDHQLLTTATVSAAVKPDRFESAALLFGLFRTVKEREMVTV